MTFMRKPLFI